MSFSVVIPAYNSEAHILNALESVLAQTVVPNEIIVVNDASFDSTEDLVLNFIQENISLYNNFRLCKLDENLGPGSARNVGVSIANFEWVLFLDSDDQWSPQRVERLNEFIESHQKAGFIFAKHKYNYGKCTPNIFISSLILSCGCVVPRWLLFFKSFIATSSIAIKKNVFGAGFTPDIRYCEDLDLWFRLSINNKLYFQNETLSYEARKQVNEGLSKDVKSMKSMTCNLLGSHAGNFFERLLALVRIAYHRMNGY